VTVIFSHSYALLGDTEPGFYGNSFGGWSVCVFFVIGGYLLAGSSNWSPIFLWKRAVRTIPAIAAVTLLLIFLIGPLVTSLSLIEYFRSPETWAYLSRIGIFWGVDKLPGVFIDNPFANAVNGSIWMMPHLMTMYFVLWIFGNLRMLNLDNRIVLICIYLFMWIIYIINSIIPMLRFSGPYMLNIVEEIVFWNWHLYFFGGVLIYFYRDHLNKLMAGSILVFIMLYITGYGRMGMPFLIPCISVYLIHFNKGINFDISYGLFVFAFPIQQTIIHFWPVPSATALFFPSLLITTCVAAFSWRFIEQPCLKYKNL
jgi:peptidoglycan/LPS O-acetylase OafA/YrhL